MYPRLLHLYGPVWIHSYGVMIALGFILFIALTLRHPLRQKYISKEIFLNTIFVGLIGGVLGGRLLFIATNFSDFLSSPLEALYPWVGGFVVLGSIIGALVSVVWYLRKNRILVLPILDLAALYAPLFQAVARFGCLFAGCCYGAHAPDLTWAITFSNTDGLAPLGIPLHPTQVYASLASFGIFLLLNICYRFFRLRFGAVISLYLMLENAARFFVDFWRGDRGQLSALGLSEMQNFSLIGMLIAMGCLVVVLRNKKQKYSYLS